MEQAQFQEHFMEKAALFMQDILDIVNKVWSSPHTNGETSKKRTREPEPEEEEIEEEEIEKEIQKTPEKKPESKKPIEKKPEDEKETKKKRAKKDSTTPSGDGVGGGDVCAGRFWLNPPLSCILMEEGRPTEGIELNTAQKFPGAAGKCKICKECGKKRKNFKQSERTRKKKEQKQNEQQTN
jgi:hypothetical protein